jgi:hypothetical protein
MSMGRKNVYQRRRSWPLEYFAIYAHEHGCPWNEETCESAASNGRFNTLAYAHGHGCSFGWFTYVKADRCGHVNTLQYEHEHGCPLDIRKGVKLPPNMVIFLYYNMHANTDVHGISMCGIAVKYGHLHVLQYAHEHGCPWDKETCDLAAFLVV